MNQIYIVTLKIVVCFIVGVILKRTGVTDSRAERSISEMLIKAVLPEVPVSVDARCCAGVTPEKHEAALLTMESCQISVRR